MKMKLSGDSWDDESEDGDCKMDYEDEKGKG